MRWSCFYKSLHGNTKVIKIIYLKLKLFILKLFLGRCPNVHWHTENIKLTVTLGPGSSLVLICLGFFLFIGCMASNLMAIWQKSSHTLNFLPLSYITLWYNCSGLCMQKYNLLILDPIIFIYGGLVMMY